MFAETSVENAAIEALKQAPGLVICLVICVLFIRHLSERNKTDAEERKDMRATLDRFSQSQQNLAIVVEGLKESMKK